MPPKLVVSLMPLDDDGGAKVVHVWTRHSHIRTAESAVDEEDLGPVDSAEIEPGPLSARVSLGNSADLAGSHLELMWGRAAGQSARGQVPALGLQSFELW